MIPSGVYEGTVLDATLTGGDAPALLLDVAIASGASQGKIVSFRIPVAGEHTEPGADIAAVCAHFSIDPPAGLPDESLAARLVGLACTLRCVGGEIGFGGVGGFSTAVTESPGGGRRLVNGLRIDHIVLWVRDVEASAEFYARALGAAPEMEEEYALGRRPFLSMRIGDALIDLRPADDPARTGARGVGHICIEVAGSDPELVRETLRAEGILVEEAVHRDRLGARGPGPSLYVTDPDGYRLELKWYEDGC